VNQPRLLPAVLILIIVTILCGCRHTGSIPVVQLQFNDASGEIKITDWQVTGPFPTGETGEPKRDAESRARTLDRDFLKESGQSENGLDAAHFLKVEKSFINFSKPSDFKNTRVTSADGVIRLDKLYRTSKNAVAYAASFIESPQDTEVVLVSGADDSAKVWLNGQELFRMNAEPLRDMPYYGNLGKAARFSTVKLNKGTNFFLVKVAQLDRMWGFNFNLLTIDAARNRAKANELYVNDVVANSIIPQGAALALSPELSGLVQTLKLPAKVEILNAKKEPVGTELIDYRSNWSKSLAGLSDGIYVCKFTCPLYSLEERFYYGDAESVLATLPERYSSLKDLRDETKFAFDALMERRRILLEPDNKKPADKVWQLKIAYVLSEFNDLLAHASDAALNYPGTHLRGFRSKIDDQVQYYMVHVPAQYAQQKAPLPLVVLVPFPIPNSTFLSSVLVANTTLVKLYTKLADQYGYALLWPYARGNIEAAPIAMTDISETMEAARKDYAFDSERIYSLGWSYGGSYALLFSERFPGVFAAITAIMPPSDLVAFEKGADQIHSFYPPSWLRLNSPVELVESLRNTNVFVIHGDEDKTISPEESLRLVDKCRKLGFTCPIEIMPGMDHVYLPVDPTPKIFSYFKDKVREKNPKVVSIATAQLKYGSAYWLSITRLSNPLELGKITASMNADGTIDVSTEKIGSYEILLDQLGYGKDKPLTVRTNNQVSFNGIPNVSKLQINVEGPATPESAIYKTSSIEGPISHAFAGPFLLVEGSGGSKEDQAAVESLGQRFRERWMKNYNVACPSKKDRDVSPDDIKNKHLVLLGNSETNSLIKELSSKIPLQIEREYISLAGKRYSGNALGIAVIYPNPLNPQKYIVIAGANNNEGYKLIDANLSLKGWYDFALWQAGAKDPELLATGHWDASWQNTVTSQ
jgi:predicted esterase